MSNEELMNCAAVILQHGPDRVMVSETEAVSLRRALQMNARRPDIVLIRNDGWSLAAPKEYALCAFHLWRAQWIGVIVVGDCSVLSLLSDNLPRLN